MKYWTLFTMRMMARLGLAMSLFAWCCSQSTGGLQITPVASASLGAGVYPWGPVLFWSNQRVGTRHQYWIYDANSRKMMEYLFHQRHTLQARYPPGLHLFSGNRKNEGTLLCIEHWLVSLTFLIATILTNRRGTRHRPARGTRRLPPSPPELPPAQLTETANEHE